MKNQIKATLTKRGRTWSIMVDRGMKWSEEKQRKVRDQQCVSTGETEEAEAEKKRIEMLHALNQRTHVEKNTITFGEWLLRWIKGVGASGTRRPRTIEAYEGVVKIVAASWIAGFTLQDLTASDLEDYLADRMKTIKPISARIYILVFHLALKKAKRDNLVPVNVAADMEGPKAPKDKGKDARIHCWTAEEAQQVIATADDMAPLWSALYAVALDTGARLRELAGLQWTKIDLAAGRVTIEQQLHAKWCRYKAGAKMPMFVPTKSGQVRTVTIAPGTVERLKALKRSQAEERLAAGPKYRADGLVFANPDGTALSVSSLSNTHHRTVCKAAGVTVIKFHGTRHTSATLALLANTPIHVLSKRLGHAEASITLNVYGHVLDSITKQPSPLGAVLFG